MSASNSPSSSNLLSQLADFEGATVTLNLPCKTCHATGVVEVGPEGTMKTRTSCPQCEGRQTVSVTLGLTAFKFLLDAFAVPTEPVLQTPPETSETATS